VCKEATIDRTENSRACFLEVLGERPYIIYQNSRISEIALGN